MICEECLQDKPLTYRSLVLKKRSVCAACIRKNHPETLNAPKPDGAPEKPGMTAWLQRLMKREQIT